MMSQAAVNNNKPLLGFYLVIVAYTVNNSDCFILQYCLEITFNLTCPNQSGGAVLFSPLLTHNINILPAFWTFHAWLTAC